MNDESFENLHFRKFLTNEILKIISSISFKISSVLLILVHRDDNSSIDKGMMHWQWEILLNFFWTNLTTSKSFYVFIEKKRRSALNQCELVFRENKFENCRLCGIRSLCFILLRSEWQQFFFFALLIDIFLLFFLLFFSCLFDICLISQTD